jgi:hypothetical protein
MVFFLSILLGIPSVHALPCPGDMIALEGGEAWVGRWVPRFGSDQVPGFGVKVSPFCIDSLPFPGQKGDLWLEDGLEAGKVALWQKVLDQYERRFCTVEELLWATAGGSANRPYLTGFTPPMYCEPNASWGDMHGLGEHTGCVNEWGIRDANVASVWAVASVEVDQVRGQSRWRDFVIVGGTNRPDTFYAPTNFGLHAHDPGDGAYFDDQLRVCADPGQGLEAEWQLFREAAALQGSFEGALRWALHHGLEANPSDVLETPFLYFRQDG